MNRQIDSYIHCLCCPESCYYSSFFPTCDPLSPKRPDYRSASFCVVRPAPGMLQTFKRSVLLPNGKNRILPPVASSGQMYLFGGAL